MVKMHDSSVVRLALLSTIAGVAGLGMPSGANAYPSFPLTDAAAKNATVKIQGSRNIEPLNQSLKQGFEKQYAGAQVAITNSSTKAALEAVIAGKADMAAIGRPLTDAEKAQGLVAIPIGREKIAIVVGKSNPYSKDLTISQFAKVFRGEAKNWSELGGPKTAIQLIDRTETDTRKAFPNYPAFQGKAFDSGKTAIKLADENPATLSSKLGTSGLSFLPASLADQPNVRVLTMHGVKPTDAKYPFSQPLYYVYKGATPNNAVKAFLGYAGSNPGQAAVTAAGIAKAINFNNTAEAAAAEKDAAAGAAAIAQAEKTTKEGSKTTAGADGANGNAKAGGEKTTTLNAPAGAGAAGSATGETGENGKTGEKTEKAGAAKPGNAVANNQIAIGDETGRGIPAWLWWLLLPLGLLGLLLWLLPKDEEDEPPLRPTTTKTPAAVGGATREVKGGKGNSIGNPLQGARDAVGGAVDAAGDAASRTTGAVGDAAKSGGAAAAGIGAAIAGAGAATLGRFKGDRTATPTPNSNAESEWEPGSGSTDEFTIETPDWNLESGPDTEGSSWLQNAKNRIGGAVDGAKDAAGNVINRTGDVVDNVTDQTGNALNTGGNAIAGTVAGAGAAAAGAGAAAWSVLSGRQNADTPDPNLDLSLPDAASNWEFEGGELPEATADVSSRMADYAIDADPGSPNLLDRATGAAGGAFNRVKSGVGNVAGNVADNVTDTAGGAIGQVKSTASNLTSMGPDGNWLNKWLGKAKDVAEDATASATNATDRLKDSIADTGAAAMAAGGATIVGAGAAVGSVFSGTGRVIMVPYNSREALVRWEMDSRAQEQMQNQGGNQLVLRLYDVTDIDVNSQDLPQFEQFDVDAAKDEQRILIPQRNRTYMTILGYLTRSGGFLEVSRSAVVQIPAA
jgi:ABC-type phosphate transport system substrate-binding protein